MADQALFDANATPATPAPGAEPAPVAQPTIPPADLFADQLAGVKNADGQPKYDSVPKALEALGNSQSHISQLENEAKARDTELAQLREQAAKHEAVEDVVARLTANKDEQIQATPQSSGLDQDAVHSVVQQALNAERQTTIRNDNLNSVYGVLTEKFGDKARDVIAEKVQELGTTTEQLKELSMSNPSLVVALFEAGRPLSSNPTSSTHNLPTGNPTDATLERPEKSLLSGATSKEQAAYMDKIREDVYKKHGVET